MLLVLLVFLAMEIGRHLLGTAIMDMLQTMTLLLKIVQSAVLSFVIPLVESPKVASMLKMM